MLLILSAVLGTAAGCATSSKYGVETMDFVPSIDADAGAGDVTQKPDLAYDADTFKESDETADVDAIKDTDTTQDIDTALYPDDDAAVAKTDEPE